MSVADSAKLSSAVRNGECGEICGAGLFAVLTLRCAVPWVWIGGRDAQTIRLILLAILSSILLVRKVRKMQDDQRKPFPFLELPAELRELVYENLLEDPYFPPPPACNKRNHGISLPSLGWILPGRRLSAIRAHDSGPKKCNWIFLVNRQCYAEFMDLMCKKSTFHLTLSAANFRAVGDDEPEGKKIWKIQPQLLTRLNRCDIKLVTTTSMLDEDDPRKMTPGEWSLSSQVRDELCEVKSVQELNLHVQSLRDHKWNPLWQWYHSSQSFKTMGLVSGTPKLHRITFSLDMWSPGENYMERDVEGNWRWYCMKGHCIGPDGTGVIPVREFCTRLYMECRQCNPESDNELIQMED